VFTWKIDSYTTDFAGLANAPASTGDIIVAMGVRSTGAADLTTASVIGGSAIKVTFAGLPAGVSATATLIGSNGFVQAIVSPNGSVTVPVVNGSYTLIGAGSVTSSTGEIYSNSANSQTFNVVGDAGLITANTYTYALAFANRLSVSIVGLPTNLTPAALTLSKAGTPSLTVIGYNGTNTFSVPSAGTWSISAASATVAGTVHLARALVPLTALASTGGVSSVIVTTAADISGAGLGLVTAGDVLATASGAIVGTVSSVAGAAVTMGTTVTVDASTQLYFYREALPSTHTIVAAATLVTAAADAFGSVGVGDRFEQADNLLLGTVASKTSATVVNFAAASTAAAAAGTVLHVAKAAIQPVTVTTGSTANAAANLIQYTSATLGQASFALTAVKSFAASTVTLTPSIATGGTPSTIAHGSVLGGATTADKQTAMAANTNTFTVTAALGSDGVTYGNNATASVVSAVGGGTRVVLNYYGAKIAVKFAGANVGDLAGYTVPISYVGPQGALAAVTRTIATTAALSGADVLVPIAGTYTVAPITAMVLGNYTYTFTVGTVSAVYQSAATEIIVNVTRTALPPSLGVTAVAASLLTAWADVDNAVTRTLTPTLAAGAAFVAAPTCVARTATAGGGSVSTLITTSVNAVTGVCTLTGALVGGTTNVFITWTGTAAGPGLSTTTETREFTISRTT
jgi:hypothetical protein